MTPEERQLIADLFDRMRSMGQVEKDREAEQFILQQVMATPDAAYMLVQSVLVQENALQEAGGRIEELEQQIAEMQRMRPQTQPQQASGGGFFGGLFGGSRNATPPPPQSVPVTQQRAPGGFGQQAPQGSPWGQPQPGGYGQQPMQQQPPQRQGGGFMKTAMATAAGVAGGMLLANSIQGMMGGNKSGEAQAAGSGSGSEASPYEVGSSGSSGGYQDPDNNDPGTYQQDNSWNDEPAGSSWSSDSSDDSEY